jgi:Cyclin, N-terminal domain
MLSPRQPYTPAWRHPSSQWLFTKSELLSTPSIHASMTSEQEKTMRTKGIQLIQEVGTKLRLHQATIATAAMFFHRFYMRKSLIDFHHYVSPFFETSPNSFFVLLFFLFLLCVDLPRTLRRHVYSSPAK